MTIHSIGESVSLASTIPLLWMSFIVLRIWGGEARQVAFKKYKSPIEWLLIGVVISFLGSMADNSYWGVTWSLVFFGHPSAPDWFSNGSFANIPFRQLAGITAGYCHVRSAFKYFEIKGLDVKASANRHLIYSSFAGFLLWWCLWWYKSAA